MPAISTFYGIVVSMYYFDDVRHHVPHIHVRYQGDKAVFAIQDGGQLAGKLPPRAVRLVQAWIEIHRDELMADWNLAIQGQTLLPIEPLK